MGQQRPLRLRVSGETAVRLSTWRAQDVGQDVVRRQSVCSVLMYTLRWKCPHDVFTDARFTRHSKEEILGTPATPTQIVSLRLQHGAFKGKPYWSIDPCRTIQCRDVLPLPEGIKPSVGTNDIAPDLREMGDDKQARQEASRGGPVYEPINVGATVFAPILGRRLTTKSAIRDRSKWTSSATNERRPHRLRTTT